MAFAKTIKRLFMIIYDLWLFMIIYDYLSKDINKNVTVKARTHSSLSISKRGTWLKHTLKVFHLVQMLDFRKSSETLLMIGKEDKISIKNKFGKKYVYLLMIVFF